MIKFIAVSFLLLSLSFVSCSGGSRSDTSNTNIPNKIVLIVSKDVSGDYTTIQAALDNSKAGDTIQVKDGVYNEGVNFTKSGTRDLPITLINFPGHSPVIDPGEGKYPSDFSLRVEINAEWIIIEGFEIRYGWDGVKVYRPHNTIRNNWIHHNRYQGILVVSTSDVFIESNTIEYNGTDSGACHNSEWGGESPKHCHGIYMSDFSCTGMSDITIRGNVLSNHGGRGIQWNGFGCITRMQNTLVDGNLIENNSWGLALYYNVEGALITNNVFINESRPISDDQSWTFMGIWGSRDNTITDNEFYTTLPDLEAISVYDNQSKDNNVNHNIWMTAGSLWVWGGQRRTDWENYPEITGWDIDGEICIDCN